MGEAIQAIGKIMRHGVVGLGEREPQMDDLLMHYAIPSDRLPDLAKVGIAYVAMFAWRCGNCNRDFHLDLKPVFCPTCGAKFDRERTFGRQDSL